MTAADADAQAERERFAHLEALAALVYDFVEEARAIDAVYNPYYAGLARELRALDYVVRDDIRTIPTAGEMLMQPTGNA